MLVAQAYRRTEKLLLDNRDKLQTVSWSCLRFLSLLFLTLVFSVLCSLVAAASLWP